MYQLAKLSDCAGSLAADDTGETDYFDGSGGSNVLYLFSVGAAAGIARTALGRTQHARDRLRDADVRAEQA